MGIISANLSFNRAGHELLDFSSFQNKYSDALLWAQDMTKNAAVGQYIYIAADETIDGVLYPKGPYVVDGIGENAAFTFLLGGNGSVTADTYAKVLDKATDDNVGQIIYLTADDTVADEATGEETVYYAGPYIVKGEGKVSKLTTTNAEDVSVTDQVEALDTRMDGLEINLNSKLDVSAHTAYTATTDAALAGKVENTEYNQFVADTNAELLKKADDTATKSAIALKLDTSVYNQGMVDLNNTIATKADDAEVKQLIGEKVSQVDYNAYTAATDAAIAAKVAQADYDAKVGELEGAIAEKVEVETYNAYTAATDAAITAKVAQTDYDAYVEANDSAVKAVKDTADEAKAWVDAFKDAENLGDEVVDTLKEIQNYINSDLEAADKMTKDIAAKVAQADYDAKVGELEGAIAEKLDVSAHTAYTAATDAALAEKLDVSVHTAYTAATDAALAEKVEVETYNAYTAATDAAIAAKVAQADYDAKIAEIEKTIEDNELVVSEALTDLNDSKANTVDVVLKEGYVAYSNEEKTKLESIENGAQVNVIEKVTLFGNELTVTDKTVAVDFQSDDIKLGTAITTVENGETKEVFGAEKTLSQTLQGIYDSLKSGLSGGVTSVTGADDSIVVSGDVNNKEVKVQISAAADNRLSLRTVDGEKGLYVEPLYYDGDDSEIE